MHQERADIEAFPIVVLAAVALFLVAIPVVHVAWALHTGDPLRKLFEEDAYYVFQVARNVAHGHGVTADGVHATSGFQPLWAVLLIPAFLTGANVSLALVAVLCLALWIAGADVFSRLLTDLLPEVGISRPARRLFFAVVFLATVPLRDLYWGGLETGLYVTLLMSVTYWFVVHKHAAQRSQLAFGVALGFLALARFEAVAFVVVLAAARAFVHAPPERRARAVVIPLLVAVVMLLPWLAFCQAVIGRPIPQSGIATGGQGIYPAPLLSGRTASVELSLGSVFSWPTTPSALNHHPGLAFAILFTVVVRFGLAWAGGIRVRADMRWVVGALAATAVAIMAVYSATTAAVWFLARYSVVVEPLQLGLTAAAVLGLVRIVLRHQPRATAVVLAGGTALTVLASVVHAGPLLDRHDQYMAAPAAELAATRVVFRCAPIGMFESGRSGFRYGMRIVNLDGKTNAAALQATVDHRLIRWVIDHHIDVVFANRGYLTHLDQRHEPWRQHYRVVDDPRVANHVWLVANDTACTP